MKNLFKKNQTKLFVVSSLAFLIVNWYWLNVCTQGGCSYRLMDTFLYPLYYGTLALSGFFAVFVFLPSHYFSAWLKWIFSWAFPISVLIVMANVSRDSGLFPIFAREVIIILSVIFGIITTLFIVWHFYRNRKAIKHQSHSK